MLNKLNISLSTLVLDIKLGFDHNALYDCCNFYENADYIIEHFCIFHIFFNFDIYWSWYLSYVMYFLWTKYIINDHYFIKSFFLNLFEWLFNCHLIFSVVLIKCFFSEKSMYYVVSFKCIFHTVFLNYFLMLLFCTRWELIYLIKWYIELQLKIYLFFKHCSTKYYFYSNHFYVWSLKIYVFYCTQPLDPISNICPNCNAITKITRTSSRWVVSKHWNWSTYLQYRTNSTPTPELRPHNTYILRVCYYKYILQFSCLLSYR